MSTKIQYEDKVALQNDEAVANKNKVTAEDMNEIKQAVNDNADELEQKQQKQEGKGLSTNDFTDELKEKLEGLDNYDDTELEQGIADLQQEQETQNANIEQLQQENTELKAKDKELELECERLREDVNALPGVSDSSENITLNGTAEARFKKLGIGGNSWQEIREGYNLVKGMASSGYSTISDDIFTSTALNSGGFSNIIIALKNDITLNESTFYISADIKIVSGTCGSINTVKLFDTNNREIGTTSVVSQPMPSSISQRYIFKVDLEEEKIANKIYVQPYSTADCILEIKNVMVSKENKDYEQYGAMPSTEFPSKIQTVKDSVNITICNKNLLKNEATSQSVNGIDFTINEDKSVKASGTATANAQLYLLGNASGTNLVLTLKANKTYKNMSGIGLVYRKTNGDYGSIINSITPTENLKLGAVYIQINSGTTVNNVYYPILTIDEAGREVYEEHKEQSFTIPVQQEMLEEDKFEKINGVWKEKHNWLKIVLNGTENLFDTSTYSTAHIKTVNFRIANKEVFNKGTDIKSNKFSKNIGLWGEDIEGVNVAEPNNIDISINRDKIENLTSIVADNKIPIQNYLKKLHDEENPIVIYVKLAEPEYLDCAEEQTAVLEEIENTAKSYKETTHIFSTDEISPIFEVEARKDMQLENDNLQTQIDEIKTLLSTTETSAMLLDNMQADLESEV